MGGVAAQRAITILGSTGSIGTQALDVVDRTGDFVVHALAARGDVEQIADQARRFNPRRVALVDPDASSRLRELLPGVDVLDGAESLIELAKDPGADVVLNAVLGAAGLEATLASLDAGIRVALANKESCVAGGPLVRRRLDAGAELVPVDSEHASVHMCVNKEAPDGIDRIVLTASGGPFRGRSRDELARVTAAEALQHPTWSMGDKITIDSATLMNKGLEVLEANVLFDIDLDRVEVVCHPQSIVHCLVGFVDGSWKSALGPPDMRVPIAYAMGFPARPDWGPEQVDWASMRELTFEPVDTETFRAVTLAYEAGATGGTAPAVLNAANEVAVAAFLDDEISFLAIADTVARVLEAGATADLGYGRTDLELADILNADGWARQRTHTVISG